ncbi:MAG: hypothetical protein JW934_06925 [Anaerolineae bacterium]|nr:hypothetical protein [Anaerolineae bacterium]
MAKRFLVSPSDFDDIGAVLNQLGKGFEHQTIDWYTMSNIQSLTGCEVLFLNCSGEASSPNSQVAKNITQFVHNGGSLYASDYAGGAIQAAFPNRISFDQNGSVGKVSCNVVDEGLSEIIGTDIDIEFDMGGWWQITDVGQDIRVFLRANSNNQPIIAGFSYGQGHVIYTSFHNKAQTSKKERDLLKYLVFRPILAQTAASAANIAKSQQFTAGKEIIASVDRGKRSTDYLYQNTHNDDMLYVLHWTDKGELRMIVRGPTGQVVRDQKSTTAPLIFEIARPITGNWHCQIEGTKIPHDNFAYVLTLARRPISQSPSYTENPQTGNKAEHKLPLYIMVDSSSTAIDASTIVTQGITQLVRNLRDISVKNVYTYISINSVNSEVNPISEPIRIGQLSSLSLPCSGHLLLQGAMDGLYEDIKVRINEGFGKALVCVLLTKEPNDSVGEAMQRIHHLRNSGYLNIIALGVGESVSAETLKQIGVLALRIEGENFVDDAFDWLANVLKSIMQSLATHGEGQSIDMPAPPRGIHQV